ncbi:uncharacterized protein L969DRAFT_49229 [Mixia osmundae IAM 14324]|uniref:Uncharacterized protein n=1 Tax=Mixia osmundae (strain CBS 9802 / IAM 14324 / JCM 22182 / KY 12970) TaxID=764103 RepID=G7E8A4_MIXOS|nr:uncharacterized protein L969DRAFT_49229 [Mixia osmundae IAM 14324]KEI39167.1 hypothetical protein L969DRAFT_49229 [Mixia osmundae IAM 14324]GAA99064.1 hypothetical protein E5Q_05753 [Mixia osmundae IAM 14324]
MGEGRTFLYSNLTTPVASDAETLKAAWSREDRRRYWPFHSRITKLCCRRSRGRVVMRSLGDLRRSACSAAGMNGAQGRRPDYLLASDHEGAM